VPAVVAPPQNTPNLTPNMVHAVPIQQYWAPQGKLLYFFWIINNSIHTFAAFVPAPMVHQVPVPMAAFNPAATTWYGPTAQEVAANDAATRAATVGAARAATDAFKPAASPGDMFWVMEADGVTKTMMSFAAIDTFNDGRWMIDQAGGTAYYLRGHPL
jgi:hypothetical protein